MTNENEAMYNKRIELSRVQPKESLVSLSSAAETAALVIGAMATSKNLDEWIQRKIDTVDERFKTPSYLSARYVTDNVTSLALEIARIPFRAIDRSQMSVEEFKLSFDMHYGASLISVPLELVSENALSKAERGEIVREGLEAFKLEAVPVNDESVYIVDNITSIQKVLMQEDSTGGKVIDETLRWVNGLPSRISPKFQTTFSLEVVSRGADLAAEVYELMYPQVEEYLMRNR